MDRRNESQNVRNFGRQSDFGNQRNRRGSIFVTITFAVSFLRADASAGDITVADAGNLGIALRLRECANTAATTTTA